MRDPMNPEQPPSGPLYAPETPAGGASGTQRGSGAAPGAQAGSQGFAAADAPKPEPIRKSLLPCTPPPEWEFSTVLGQPAGCLLAPGQHAGFPVVRRRVSYSDWEPVTPDHWAEEEPSDAATAGRPAPVPVAHATPCGPNVCGVVTHEEAAPAPEPGLREQYAAAIRDAACTGDCNTTEEACAQERIQPVVWHSGRLAEVSGTPELFADAVHAVRDTELQQLRAQVERARLLVVGIEAQAVQWKQAAEQAEAALARVRKLAEQWQAAMRPGERHPAAQAALAALDQPQEQAARCCDARIGHLPTCRTNQPPPPTV